MKYEWDPIKAETNLEKHHVSFEDALGVFEDPLRIEFEDEKHSTEEQTRYATIGIAVSGLLYVVFREVTDNVVRIIHARRADPRMVKLYEKRNR